MVRAHHRPISGGSAPTTEQGYHLACKEPRNRRDLPQESALLRAAADRGIAGHVKAADESEAVVDAKTGESLWRSDASMGGKLWRSWGSIAKSLLSDIQKRLK